MQPNRHFYESVSLSFCGQDDVVAFSFAQQQVLAEKQIARRQVPLEVCLAHVVDIDAPALNVLSRLPLGGTQAGNNQRFRQAARLRLRACRAPNRASELLRRFH